MTKAPEGASGQRRVNLGEECWCRRPQYSTARYWIGRALRSLGYALLGILLLVVWFGVASNP